MGVDEFGVDEMVVYEMGSRRWDDTVTCIYMSSLATPKESPSKLSNQHTDVFCIIGS